MDEERIRERAEGVRDAFDCEAWRFEYANPMHELLDLYGSLAFCVSVGKYQRGVFFCLMVECLGALGVDVSDVDTSPKPEADGVAESARNARDDTHELWRIVSSRSHVLRDGCKPSLSKVVSFADDLMESLMSGSDAAVTCRADNLDKAVTAYLMRWDIGDAAASREVGSDGGAAVAVPPAGALPRESPERVIFNPPATIAFWGDGTKTVARCAEGDEFSEHTGLLVCIAKRHLRVPRRATFEDAMAKLLKRAERQRRKPAKSGEAA